MKMSEPKKKVWARPVVITLSIKKDTFSGSGTGAEDATKNMPKKEW
jgi:hypothetical protein